MNTEEPAVDASSSTGPAVNGGILRVERFTRLVGEPVVLLPIERGEKGPHWKDWQKTTVDQMKDPRYLARFSIDCNVGVLLGRPSGNLCSIDCDDDDGASEMLGLNPRLARTLRTQGYRGCNFWARVRGAFPKLTCLKTRNGEEFGEWRADGGQTIIDGLHPNGVPYRIVVEAPPIEIEFDEIMWPERLVLPWVGERLQKYGAPLILNSKGVPTGINERYWAGMILAENRLLHDPDDCTFYLYDATRGLWRPITAECLRERISVRLFQYRVDVEQPAIEKLITHSKIDGVVEVLRGMAERRGAFDDRSHTIHVANGMITFPPSGDVQLDEFRPDHFSRNQSPLRFDCSAHCPRFLNDLLAPAIEGADMDLLQRWAGMALLGHNLAQRILLLTGTPGGGKSTLASILASVVGRENVYQLRTESLLERFETYRYRGKTLLIGADVPGDFLMRKGASILKSLVGGDLLSAEGKGLNGDFQMRGQFNVLITCNSRLTVRLEGDTGAWRRRLIVIDYNRPPPGRKISGFDQLLLREEGAGILRWALAGFASAAKEFASHGDFILAPEQQARVDGLLAESDSVAEFLSVSVESADGCKVSSNEMVEAYGEYCAQKGWRAVPTAELYRLLDDLVLRNFQVTKRHDLKRDGRNVRGWKGLRLL